MKDSKREKINLVILILLLIITGIMMFLPYDIYLKIILALNGLLCLSVTIKTAEERKSKRK